MAFKNSGALKLLMCGLLRSMMPLCSSDQIRQPTFSLSLTLTMTDDLLALYVFSYFHSEMNSVCKDDVTERRPESSRCYSGEST